MWKQTKKETRLAPTATDFHNGSSEDSSLYRGVETVHTHLGTVGLRMFQG